MPNPDDSTDSFIAIARLRGAEAAQSLQASKPPPRPEKVLPLTHRPKQPHIPPAAKPHEALAVLQKQIKTLRRQYAPFLKNRTPSPSFKQKTVELTAFQWRLEDSGPWRSVTLPHYQGPTGRSFSEYKAEVTLPDSMIRKGEDLWFCCDSADYIAEVYWNGHVLGTHEGFFAPFEFLVPSRHLQSTNTLSLRLKNDAIMMGNHPWGLDEEGDKLYAATGPGWDDPDSGWHHCPPGFGLIGPVRIESRSQTFLHDLWVRPTCSKKEVEVWCEIWHTPRDRREVKVEASLYGKNFQETVFTKRNLSGRIGDSTDRVQVASHRNDFRFTLPLSSFRFWEPDEPWLYELELRLVSREGKILDTQRTTFGMRDFHMDENSHPKGRFYLNGREIKLRGANTMGFEEQALFHGKKDQLIDDLLLAKAGHMNFLRLTQRPVQKDIYDLCDALGILIQTDFPLFSCLRRSKIAEALRQAEEMERHIRAHPCCILATFMNEPVWNGNGKPHRNLTRPELETWLAMAADMVRLSNPDRAIKPLDGDYDPPSPGYPDRHCYTFWYNGHEIELGRLIRGEWVSCKPDWMVGCGEFGVEGLDPLDLMARRYPAEWLHGNDVDWTPNRIPKSQTAKFQPAWFDRPKTTKEWVDVSQAHQTWGIRLQTEAFRRMNRMNSFAVHLFIDAFPSGWMKALVDCERKPKPAWFAYQNALAPLAVQIRTDRFTVWSGEPLPIEFWICNDTHEIPKGCRLHYQITLSGKVQFKGSSAARTKPMQALCQGTLPWRVSPVNARETLDIDIALLGPQQQVIHQSTERLHVLPPPKPAKAKVEIVGRSEPCASLLTSIGGKRSRNADVLWCSDPQAFEKRSRAILQRVKEGATLVLHHWPEGRYRVGPDRILIQKHPLGPVHFVSRNTQHPMMSDFQTQDFKYWFCPEDDCIRPFLHTAFQHSKWTSLLITGDADSAATGNNWHAAAERTFGKGRIILNLLHLAGRTEQNPGAYLFAEHLTHRI